ncbi:MAG: Fe3+/spermidine/putrescine ABC transporter ATP-binding protein [Tagaea sp. CACIAM 22H2]|nr:Fe3+/spermidine/putrescine ABC transporter ATP-binding protein [Tagaea sp. CACIAM 22H2]
MKLEVQNLVRRFGNALALDGASLDANSGEIVALLGPSGCGKTTTLRIVAGFESSDSGHVMLGGEEIGRLPPHKRDIGLVFQDYALFPHMTVADNVAYGLKRRGVAKAERAQTVARVLETVRLSGLEARRPAQLSGGQQQRVALARALAIRPRLLLLDEPLSNLDAKLRGVLQTELREILTRVGTTTLIVTHDQEEAMALADRIAVMRNGRTLQLGTPRQVYEKPATRFVAEFLGKSLWLEGKLDGARFVTDTGFSLRCAPAYLSAARYGLMLRPEALSLKSRLGDGDGFPATVKSVRYRGHAELLELDIAGRLTVSIEVPHGAPIPEPGTRVAIGFDPARALPVPEDTD